LFGWRIESIPQTEDYAVIYNKDRPIGGIVTQENWDPKAAESLWLPVLSVADVDQSAAAARRAGGKVLDGPFNAVGRG
jgi:predicted enzyme related to lactoylglutathione lyase